MDRIEITLKKAKIKKILLNDQSIRVLKNWCDNSRSLPALKLVIMDQWKNPQTYVLTKIEYLEAKGKVKITWID